MVKMISKQPVSEPLGIECCHRCGGLMIPERVYELSSYNWRCVSCGERIDPVILHHRREEVARAEAEKMCGGRGKSRLG